MGQSFCHIRAFIPGGVPFIVVTERRSLVMSNISITTCQYGLPSSAIDWPYPPPHVGLGWAYFFAPYQT